MSEHISYLITSGYVDLSQTILRSVWHMWLIDLLPLINYAMLKNVALLSVVLLNGFKRTKKRERELKKRRNGSERYRTFLHAHITGMHLYTLCVVGDSSKKTKIHKGFGQKETVH